MITLIIKPLFAIVFNYLNKTSLVKGILIFNKIYNGGLIFKSTSQVYQIYGIDSFSLWLTLIVNITAISVYLNAYKNKNLPENIDNRMFTTCLLSIIFLSNIVFLTRNLKTFYIAFEAILIPMYFCIGYFGASNKRIKALYLLIIYTLTGSLFLLIGIIYKYFIVGSKDLSVLATYKFSLVQQKYLFILFKVAFAVKLPMFPFHIWLPVVH